MPDDLDTTELAQIRLTLADALAAGSGDAVVASYLELVHALVDAHQLVAAATELEYALLRLPRSTLAMWRLQLCLAGLYSGLGDLERARRTAQLGHDLARGAASAPGQQRAKGLLARLTPHGPKASPLS